MYDANGDALVLEIQTQESSDHIQCALACVMCIIAASFALMPELDASTFRADKDYFAPIY